MPLDPVLVPDPLLNDQVELNLIPWARRISYSDFLVLSTLVANPYRTGLTNVVHRSEILSYYEDNGNNIMTSDFFNNHMKAIVVVLTGMSVDDAEFDQSYKCLSMEYDHEPDRTLVILYQGDVYLDWDDIRYTDWMKMVDTIDFVPIKIGRPKSRYVQCMRLGPLWCKRSIKNLNSLDLKMSDTDLI